MGAELTDNSQTKSLDELAIAAADCVEKSDSLIRLFRPFIANCVRKFVYDGDAHKFEDMNSVAMTAFYEAINSYDKSKGHFLSFANLIINRRLTDELRKDYRYTNKQVVTDFEDEDTRVATGAAAVEAYAQQAHRDYLRLEIEQFKDELAKWGITLPQLALQSPKHKALKEEIRCVIDAILSDGDIVSTIINKKYLPVKKIAELSKTTLKKIENSRKYIIGVVLIKKGDYQYLSGYIDQPGGETVSDARHYN